MKRADGSRDLVTVPAFDGAEAYTYPKPGNRIGWDVNAAEGGVNLIRGVRRPDGVDEAQSIAKRARGEVEEEVLSAKKP
jgi:hypothetical protein